MISYDRFRQPTRADETETPPGVYVCLRCGDEYDVEPGLAGRHQCDD